MVVIRCERLTVLKGQCHQDFKGKFFLSPHYFLLHFYTYIIYYMFLLEIISPSRARTVVLSVDAWFSPHISGSGPFLFPPSPPSGLIATIHHRIFDPFWA